MAVVDVKKHEVTIKIVYYGCAMGGKTTNLQTLHRLTDPSEQQGLVSIATQDDRTLFFDLLPMDLGRVGGLEVRAKVYTVPGQVHYELTRRQVLAGTDAVVMVYDSAPGAAKSNLWAAENVRFNLRANGFDPAKIPLIVQWNKRDLPDARPVEEMRAELNAAGQPEFESVATTGTAVVSTFAAAVQAAIESVYAKTGHGATISRAKIDEVVDRALADAKAREPETFESAEETAPSSHEFERRVDTEAYREKWAEETGRDRQILDQDTLLGEAMQANMQLAERIDGFRRAERVGERRAFMMKALGQVAPSLVDPGGKAIPPGALEMLLRAAGRVAGSILLFQPGQDRMEEREVAGFEDDPLNAVTAPGVGTPAVRLCKVTSGKLIEDLASEVFFDAPPPQAANLSSALISPLACDGLSFGALVVYGGVSEPRFDAAEREYWSTVTTFVGLSLHWRALRRKVGRSAKAAG